MASTRNECPTRDQAMRLRGREPERSGGNLTQFGTAPAERCRARGTSTRHRTEQRSFRGTVNPAERSRGNPQYTSRQQWCGQNGSGGRHRAQMHSSLDLRQGRTGVLRGEFDLAQRRRGGGAQLFATHLADRTSGASASNECPTRDRTARLQGPRTRRSAAEAICTYPAASAAGGVASTRNKYPTRTGTEQ